MRYWIDTEFIDDGICIDLISIGIVAEDGREYYAQDKACMLERANDWVKQNVIPHLDDRSWQVTSIIRHKIDSFMDAERYGKPELWGWCCAYDYVALCQLFGTMMDTPSGWPHYMRDLQHVLDVRGISDDELPQQEGAAHNALSDARHIKKLCEHVLKGSYGWGIK